MSRRNRQRATECIAGHGAWLTLRDKLALWFIGDLVKDHCYWESQGQLAARMGVSRRTAGDAVRKLEKHDALRFDHWFRTDGGSTVKVFEYQPEYLTAEVSESFPPDMSESVPPQVSGTFPPAETSDSGQVGRNTPPGGKEHDDRWEENPAQVSGTFPQTEEPETENRENRHKVAAAPRRDSESQIAIISETIADNILDNPQLLEAERHRQKAALIGATT